MRVQDDLCVDEVPRGDSLVQSLAKSSGSRHLCKRFDPAPPVIGRIYSTCMMQRVRLFRVEPSKRGEVDGSCMILAAVAYRCLGLGTSELNSNGYSYATNPNNRDKIIEIDDMKCLLQSVAVAWGQACAAGDAENARNQDTFPHWDWLGERRLPFKRIVYAGPFERVEAT